MNARQDGHTEQAHAAPPDTAAADALRMAVSQVMHGAPPQPAPPPASAMPAPGASAEQQAGAAAHAVSLSGLPALLPRLSEYRIAQVGKAAAAFDSAHTQFWQSSARLGALHEEMHELARSRGLALPDLAQQLKPDGALAPMRQVFDAALAEAPAAQVHKRAMDKALDSYIRQYGRAQEEILNPELADNPHYDGLKLRLAQSHQAMQAQAASVPAFTNASGVLEASHGAKLDTALAAIGTRMQAARDALQSMQREARGAASEPGF